MENDSSCSVLLKQIHDVQEKNINNTLRNLDLTFSQINVLRALVHSANKQMSLKE